MSFKKKREFILVFYIVGAKYECVKYLYL